MRAAAASLLLLVALSTIASGCRDSSAVSTTPRPAASVRFIAGSTFGPSAPGVADGRVVIAYVHDTATPAQVRRLAERIAALPEVEQYAFMDKDDALEFFRERFGESTTGQAVPLPQGFWLLLRAPGQASRVAAELTDEPALKQDGSTLSGVRPAREFYEWVDGGD